MMSKHHCNMGVGGFYREPQACRGRSPRAQATINERMVAVIAITTNICARRALVLVRPYVGRWLLHMKRRARRALAVTDQLSHTGRRGQMADPMGERDGACGATP